VSVGYEYSAGGRPRSGLLPRKTMAMENMAAAGNILSRLRRAARQSASLRARGDGVIADQDRIKFGMALLFCVRQ
jgi:hypothetical protein